MKGKRRKPTQPPAVSPLPGASKRERRTHYSAREKTQAVLSLWAERRKPSQICKELGITWGQLNQWQARAMTGMLAALESPVCKEETPKPPLAAKLQRLLERQAGPRGAKLARLQQRLSRIQEPPATATASPSGTENVAQEARS